MKNALQNSHEVLLTSKRETGKKCEEKKACELHLYFTAPLAGKTDSLVQDHKNFIP